MTPELCIRIAAISGFLTVVLGAFGAHSLKGMLEAHGAEDIWNKAVLYHMFHTIALFGVGLRGTANMGAAMGFIVGIILFSGSLYVLALSNLRWLGAVTPLRGVAFLVGWVMLLIRR